MLAVCVALAGVVGAFVVGVGEQTKDTSAATITAEMETGERCGNPKIVFVHVAGDALDVRDLTVRVFVDGQPLEKQPDVPFFSESGFVSGPDGPFNSNTGDKTWTAGESASLTIAGSNSPQPSAGASVTTKIYVNGTVVATARAQ